MKKIFTIIIVLLFAGTAWYYRFSIEKYFNNKFPALAQAPIEMRPARLEWASARQ